MNKVASVQETSLDILWIRERVVCLSTRGSACSYRAVLTVEGPPEAFAQEDERVQPVLDGFAQFLNALAQPGIQPPAAVQVLVLAQPADLGDYATRLEQRASALPHLLAREALADAAWARKLGPGLGLLERRAYLVVPADALGGTGLLGPLNKGRPRLGRLLGARHQLDETAARRALDERCAELIDRLAHGSVWAQRLDDAELVRLFHTCWSRPTDSRFEQDLRACAVIASTGRS
jgi:hypothetical protein